MPPDRPLWEERAEWTAGDFFNLIMQQAHAYFSAQDTSRGSSGPAFPTLTQNEVEAVRDRGRRRPVQGMVPVPVEVRPTRGPIPSVGIGAARGRARRPITPAPVLPPQGVTVVIKEGTWGKAAEVVVLDEAVRRQQRAVLEEQQQQETQVAKLRSSLLGAKVAARDPPRATTSWWSGGLESEPSTIRLNLNWEDGSSEQVRAPTSSIVLMQGDRVVGRAWQDVIQRVELIPGVDLEALGLAAGRFEPFSLGAVPRPVEGHTRGEARNVDELLDIWDDISFPGTPAEPRVMASPPPVPGKKRGKK